MLLSRKDSTDADFIVTMSLKSRFPVPFGVYNYDVICDVIASIQTFMSRPISPELVLSPDFWISNTPRYFSFASYNSSIPWRSHWYLNLFSQTTVKLYGSFQMPLVCLLELKMVLQTFDRHINLYRQERVKCQSFHLHGDKKMFRPVIWMSINDIYMRKWP